MSGLKGGCGNCRRGVKSAQPADKWIHHEHEMSEHGVMEALRGTSRRARTQTSSGPNNGSKSTLNKLSYLFCLFYCLNQLYYIKKQFLEWKRYSSSRTSIMFTTCFIKIGGKPFS